ncbi:MAG: hypothetical protein JOZ55_00015 [Alphaproteobacteria bacterium]|nr:hypothetical protein [Alphaproteobacteria bacterium]
MLKDALAVIAGLVLWVVIISVLGFIMRESWPAYAAADPSMAFTFPMKVARLLLSSVGLVAAAVLVARLAVHTRYAELALGILLLIVFIPIHIQLWNRFPIWYHLTFLVSLVVLPLVTETFVSRRGSELVAPA